MELLFHYGSNGRGPELSTESVTIKPAVLEIQKNKKNWGCRECLLHLDCRGARWRGQIGATTLMVRFITVYSMGLAVVDGIFWEICLRDLVGEEM